MAMIQFDYESVRSRLISSLQAKMQGRILDNSTASFLIDIWAEEFDRVSAYNEYLGRENKWSLAQNTSSIMTQIDLFGYNPHRKKGASGFVEVSAYENFNDKHSNNILIPKFTRFSDGNLTYCSSEDVILPNTSDYVEVPVVQGELRSTGEFTGDSFSGDIYGIENPDIENGLYELRNNGLICKEVSWFGETKISVNNNNPDSSSSFEYRIRNVSDFSGIQLLFASGSHGPNDHFEFKYLITEGENGSCFAKWSENSPNNGITKVMDSVTDSAGYSVRLYVRNRTAISGGTDYESVEDIRENAPYTFNRVDKIITYNDYMAAIHEVIPDCIFQIWTEASQRYGDNRYVMDDASEFINNCKIFFAGIKYDLDSRSVDKVDSDELYSAVTERLADKKGVTDYFVISEPDVWKFYINGKVYYDNNKTSGDLLRSQVSENILAHYQVDKAQFGDPVYYSEYISVFSGISGINHVDVNAVMYTEIEKGEFSSGTMATIGIHDFKFKTVDSPSIAMSGRYVFSSAQVNDPSNNKNLNLIMDLFYTEQDSQDPNVWQFYDMEGNLLSNGGSHEAVSWNNTEPDDNLNNFSLPSIKIDTYTTAGKKIWYGGTTTTSTGDALDVNSMIVRFIPKNSNCSIYKSQQILIYSDAVGDGWPGVLDPWVATTGTNNTRVRAGKNVWANTADLSSWGAGLEFIGE